MLPAQHSHLSLKHLIGCLAITTGLIIGTTALIFAQVNLSESDNQIALTAIPPRMGDDNSLLLQPGEKRQVTIKLINSSKETITVRSIAQDFVVDEDADTPVPIDVAAADNRWSLASWLTITPATQTIAPQQTVGFNVLIEVPEEALPGGHYAMITHQPNLGKVAPAVDATANSQTTGVNQRVGTLMYVVVAGPINEQAFIRNFQVPGFLEFGPVPFSYIIENESDVHIRPQMGVQIKNIFGQKVADIQPETRNIFPFTSRKFEGQWDRIWGFGRYTAEVIVTYGTTNQLVVASASFWLLPIKLIIAVIAMVLLLILGGMSIRRHLIHRKQDQSKKIAELESKLKTLESEKLKKFEE